MLPTVSIIIVVHNGEKTIKKAIDSVLQQTYPNKELLIIDGLSTDNTINIIKSHNHPALKFISEKDTGIYDAMNKGLKLASGEWVYFLGADDYLYNAKVLDKIFNDNNTSEYDYVYGNVVNNKFGRKYDGLFDEKKILKKNISHQAIFYKKTIHQITGCYNTNFRLFADWDFNIKCFYQHEIKKKYFPEIIAYFSREGESTKTPDIHFLRSILFPYNLKILNKEGARQLCNIKTYDEWWRLIRSLRIRSDEISIKTYISDAFLPAAIARIYLRQKGVDQAFLSNGLISKILMFLSYCVSRLKGEFK